jgi:ADP-ribosylglycohydrolase
MTACAIERVVPWSVSTLETAWVRRWSSSPPMPCRASYPDGLRDIVSGGPFNWAPGDPTDDTDLTWSLARGYLDADFDRSQVLSAAADRMAAWYAGGPPDVGGTTATALRAYRRSGDPKTSGSAENHAQANGSLMRTMPVAIARLGDMALRASEARALSAVTHAHPVCLDACVVYCDIAGALVNGAPVDTAIDGALERSELNAEVRAAVGNARGSGDFAFDDLSGPRGGYVLWSLKVAIRTVTTAPDVEEGLVAVVMLGDDADTNGAIAGGLLGARDGLDGIPSRWTDRLRLADDLINFADAALARGGRDV